MASQVETCSSWPDSVCRDCYDAILAPKLVAARLMAARIEGLRLRLNGVAPSHENDEASLPFWFTPLLEAKFAWDAAGAEEGKP